MPTFYFYIPAPVDDSPPRSLRASGLRAFLEILAPLVSPLGWPKKLVIGRMYPCELAPFDPAVLGESVLAAHSFAPIFDLTTGEEQVVAYLLSRRQWWKSLLPSDEEEGYYAAP